MNLRIILRARLALAIAIALSSELASSAEQIAEAEAGRWRPNCGVNARKNRSAARGGVLRTRGFLRQMAGGDSRASGASRPARSTGRRGMGPWGRPGAVRDSDSDPCGRGADALRPLARARDGRGLGCGDFDRRRGGRSVRRVRVLVVRSGARAFRLAGAQVVRSEMRKGRSCKVLDRSESKPEFNQLRARALVDRFIEHRGILRAEGYDRERRLLKEFSIGSFKKVQGRWQLKSMEIRNEATDARTRIEFDLEIEDR